MTVVIGDSIPAGHHRDGGSDPTICNDEFYSLGFTVWQNMISELPAQWKRENGYVNLAYSGFNTDKIRGGGKDACGTKHSSPLSRAQTILTQNAGSWNRVIEDGGIDNTNWGEALSAILSANAQQKLRTSDQCKKYVNKTDFLSDQKIRTNISNDVQYITKQLALADQTARHYWLGYYNVAGTPKEWGGVVGVPSFCQDSIASALDNLHGLLRNSMSTSDATWVDIDPVLGSQADRLQLFYVITDPIFRKSGWPHPNRLGASAVGDLVASTKP
jgi:hypothetical protein